MNKTNLIIDITNLEKDEVDDLKIYLIGENILFDEETISEFTKEDFDRNEDENEHTKNSYELAKMFGDSDEKSQMTKLYNKTRKVGSYLTESENDFVITIQSKYYRRLK
tara:strand:- start:1268 stop:1594 length:327 start_codon:yes stop_codon:yes gene_type:complete